MKRGEFATLTSGHLQKFEGLLGKERVITDKDDLVGYNKDWLNMVCGKYNFCQYIYIHYFIVVRDEPL